jgi:hypothetical protein
VDSFRRRQFSPPTIVENTPLAWALPNAYMALELRRVGDKWRLG